MSSIPRPLVSRISNVVATRLGPAVVGAGTVLTLQFPAALASKKVLLRALRMTHQAGSAVNNTLVLYEDSPVTLLGKVATFVPVPVANLISFDDLNTGGQGDEPICVKLDASARLYAVPTPDAGNDNYYLYVLDYEEVSTQAPADVVN